MLVPAKFVKGKIELLIRPIESEVPDDLKNGKNKVACEIPVKPEPSPTKAFAVKVPVDFSK